MSNQEPTPGNSQSSTPEQIPHSGKSGHEKPVLEFDKPLSEAPLDYDPRTEEGDLTTEHLPEDLRVPHREQSSRAQKQHENLSIRQKILKSNLGKAAIGVSTAILAVSVVTGLKFANDVSNAVEADRSPDTNSSGPAVPGEVETTTQFLSDDEIAAIGEMCVLDSINPNYAEDLKNIDEVTANKVKNLYNDIIPGDVDSEIEGCSAIGYGLSEGGYI